MKDGGSMAWIALASMRGSVGQWRRGRWRQWTRSQLQTVSRKETQSVKWPIEKKNESIERFVTEWISKEWRWDLVQWEWSSVARSENVVESEEDAFLRRASISTSWRSGTNSARYWFWTVWFSSQRMMCISKWSHIFQCLHIQIQNLCLLWEEVMEVCWEKSRSIRGETYRHVWDRWDGSESFERARTCDCNSIQWWAFGTSVSGCCGYVKKQIQQFDVIVVDSSDPVTRGDSIRKDVFKSLRESLRPGGIVCTQGECIWLHLDISGVLKDCADLYPVVDYAYTTILLSIWSIGFMVSSKGPKPANVCTDSKTRSKMNLYYTSDIHRAAFVLPAFAESKIAPFRKRKQWRV